MIRLDVLKQLEAKATSGPWFRGAGTQIHGGADNRRLTLARHCADSVEGRANANLIVESRNALPELLDWIERAIPILEFANRIGGADNLALNKRKAAYLRHEAAKLLGELE